jgi:hypothetical protein
MAPDLYNLDRRVRFWSVVAVGSLVGLRVAVDTYSGPSIALGVSIAFGVAVTFGLASLWLREPIARGKLECALQKFCMGHLRDVATLA